MTTRVSFYSRLGLCSYQMFWPIALIYFILVLCLLIGEMYIYREKDEQAIKLSTVKYSLV